MTVTLPLAHCKKVRLGKRVFVMPFLDYTPELRMVSVPANVSLPQCKASSQFPPLHRWEDGRIMVDWWDDPKGQVAKLWIERDHPNLSRLPAGTPKEMRNLYTAPMQLALLRGGALKAVESAHLQWGRWINGRQVILH